MERNAVLINKACKSYGSKLILDNLCMNVPRGTIYGLLGASGCGKTTLLSCIVGRKTLQSGEIWTLGGAPGTKDSGVPGSRVGYMPQDVALVAEFTVKDAVYYFGKIFGMTDSDIEQQFIKLIKLLDLPPQDRFVKNCSGGQQRRVSFAAALINNPELLILDEPTVGLDPVLRESIWTYLVEIAETFNTTVIITTHYIEEASQAHKIGLMRGGKLLAEESPQRLMTLFRTDSLEQVFLILSRQQSEGRLHDVQFESVHDDQNNSVIHNAESNISIVMSEMGNGSTNVLTPDPPKAKKKKMQSGFSFNKNRLKALLFKNWLQFYRNAGGISFILIFPIIETLAFLLAIGGDIKDIKIGVLNDENFMSNCANYTPVGTAIPYDESECEFHNLGCRFFDVMKDPMLEQVPYYDIDEALDGIKHGSIVGLVYIPQNFSQSLKERLSDGRSVTNEALTSSQIQVWLDMSNRQIGATIKYELVNKIVDFQKSIFADCNFFAKLGDIPIKFEEDVYGHRDETYTVFMTPGVLITIIFFLGTTNTSTIIITDRLEGVWDRSCVAGVSSLEIMVTHFIAQFLIILVQTAEVMILTFAVFKTEYVGNLIGIVVLMVLDGLCGMSFGLWISVLSNSHSMANIVSCGSFYPMILICGLVWPLEGMPKLLRWLSCCLPFTIPIVSLRNVIKKGWNLLHLEVLNGIGVQIFWILFLALVSMYMIKSKR